MSAKKNTLFNYFKRTSSVGGSPSVPATPPSATKATKPIAKSNPFCAAGDAGAKRPPPAEDGFSDDDLDPEAVNALFDSFEKPQGKRPRKRIKMMSESSEEEDIDKDDDVGDPDFAATAAAAAESSEESSDHEEDEDMESLQDIKDKLQEKFSSNKLKKSPPTPKTVASPKPGKENHSTPSRPSLKSKLSSFASPTTAKPSETPPKTAQDLLTFPHLKLPWLTPEGIKDKAGRRPDHPDYDGSTLHVPESFLKDQTPAQHQWWKMKADHFDCVLFFKMGKFYELFHMDAVLAVEKCGLTYMKAKDYAHCGFPEVGYQKYGEMMVDLGYKVARIEQTETPQTMDQRVKQMHRPSKFDKVVKREICQITSRGTRLGSSASDLAYLVAISGEKLDGQRVRVGMSFVDASVGVVHVSGFVDDASMSKLETMLAFYPPSELLYDAKTLPTALHRVVDKFPSAARKFPDSKKTLKVCLDIVHCLSDFRLKRLGLT